MLRIETTANDVSFFNHHRRVDHRDGTSSKKIAPLRKTIHSLGALREFLCASNRRYLAFMAQLETPHGGPRQLDNISRPCDATAAATADSTSFMAMTSSSS